MVTGNWVKGQRIALLDMQGREVQSRIASADDIQLEFDLTEASPPAFTSLRG